ncbi:MAG: CRISPR-associated endonuclease Cas2 [Gomphosphaeria aponina SAG 52.96 = DSM 107014]|uniref:CRISPR-associated endoribonuclease Cas2 n=1 Tax=Gomphosphaeria aponina SAG 52.96 = DSM 107014 TaxID=1521640 RepID=A0A941GS66_9CHRO|nr:CRISPR-associated endonuclease Cas2 [Gomphosphaeria aponina SAG 52.96 = DSM 107014]
MLFYLVAYDIPCDKRRRKVAELLLGYGKRVQYSVFECVLSSKKYDELCKRLRKRIKEEEDNIRFYPVSRHTLSRVQVWGQGPSLTQASGSIIV